MSDLGHRLRRVSMTAMDIDWRTLAQDAEAYLQDGGYRDRTSAYAKVSKDRNVNIHVVRRSVSAYRSLTLIAKKDPNDAGVLERLTFTALECVLRWYAYDKITAIVQANAYLDRTTTVEKIMEAERAARARRPAMRGFFS